MEFLSNIGSAVIDAWRTISGYLVALIYDFIVILYDIFIYLSRVEILNSEFIQNIYSKVGSILVLFMVFKLSFSLINSLINPDKFNDKKNGFTAIIIRCVFSIVLLGITPTIFKELFVVQKLIIGADNSSDNVLYKLILSDAIVSDSTTFGKTLASNLFFSFYTDDEYPKLGIDTIQDANGNLISKDINWIKDSVVTDGSFFNAVQFLNIKGSDGEYVIEYKDVFPIIVGVFLVWILVMYCIQTAVRVFQLAYLQLIAPVPILSYISDPDGSFKKWINQCVSTFLDLFIRLLIIYFILYLCDYINKNIDNIITVDLGIQVGSGIYIWIYIFLILGLFLFAKKVPDLLKDVFPIKGGAGKFSFGLNPKKVFNDTLAAGAIGAVGGAVGAGVSNAIHGYMNMKKSFKENGGWKSGKAWGKAAVSGLKGTASVVGGVLGGAKAGLKTKDIGKVGEAVKTANTNRTKREQRVQAGEHWYNPLPGIENKILEFSGDRTADDIKNMQSAKIEAANWEKQNAKGERIYKRFDGKLSYDNGKLKDGVFQNKDYIESWEARARAKKKVKDAENSVELLQREATAAYTNYSGTEAERRYRIEVAEKRLANARDNLRAANGELEIAKNRHENNQKIYKEDAEIEKLFGKYDDTHKSVKEVDAGVDSIPRPVTSSNLTTDSEQTSHQLTSSHDSSDSNTSSQSDGPVVENYKPQSEIEIVTEIHNPKSNQTSDIDNAKLRVNAESKIEEEMQRLEKTINTAENETGGELTMEQYARIAAEQEKIEELIVMKDTNPSNTDEIEKEIEGRRNVINKIIYDKTDNSQTVITKVNDVGNSDNPVSEAINSERLKTESSINTSETTKGTRLTMEQYAKIAEEEKKIEELISMKASNPSDAVEIQKEIDGRRKTIDKIINGK